MTADECHALPNGTEVHLPDGRRARMAIWHKATNEVGLRVPGHPAPITVKCEDLEWDDTGRLVWRPRAGRPTSSEPSWSGNAVVPTTPLKHRGRCSGGALADLEISPDGWDAVPPWFQLRTACTANCAVTYAAMTGEEVRAIGWIYEGTTDRWSRLANTS
jgi:hypothetical protein